MTFLSMRELHEQIAEAESIDALYSQVAVMLDCPLAEARAYIAQLVAVSSAGFQHHPEAREALACALFVNGYLIGKRDGQRDAYGTGFNDGLKGVT